MPSHHHDHRREITLGHLYLPVHGKNNFLRNLFNNMLHHTSLIVCLAGLLCAIAAKATGRHGRQVSQIATAIFLPPALSGLHLIKFLLIQR